MVRLSPEAEAMITHVIRTQFAALPPDQLSRLVVTALKYVLDKSPVLPPPAELCKLAGVQGWVDNA